MAHFRFETEVPGLRCVFDPDEVLEFRYTSPAPIVVSIKARERQGQLSGLIAVCTATITMEIARTLKEEIDGVTEGDRLSTTKIKPDALKFIADVLLNLLCPRLRSTIIILNWTHGLDSLPDPFGTSSGSYSEDGERWFRISLARSIGLDLSSATHAIYARNVRVDDVRSKVEAGAEEPLGRQLFREAWSQMGTNPRSALVIGVTAAEVGLKRLIGTLIPAANWLVQETQTPPVRKILRDFLPTLPIKARRLDGGPITPPRTLIKEIEKAVEHRNKIVHVGAPPPAKDELARMLIAISDLLWLCDVYTGEHWAIKHVSSQNSVARLPI
jgi:hypothetical protein